jgi:hypothetical protein
MRLLTEVVTDLALGADALQCRAHGMIEARDGRFQRVVLRPLPKFVSLPEVMFLGRYHHRRRRGDHCVLYYDQPRQMPNYLAVKYLCSDRDTTVGTLRRILETLDEIARIKRTDAIVCDVSNWDLSTAIMTRLGWEPHCPSLWHRNFIRRFYGNYPPKALWIGNSGGEVAGLNNALPLPV